MISWQIWGLFLGYAVPMVISPGPGNTLLATTGGRSGVWGSVPFWAGFEVGNLLLCLIYGLGLGRALHDHPEFDRILKWAGTVYLLYLAWGFFHTSAKPNAEGDTPPAQLSCRDGFFSVALNPKIHSMILVMLSQFLDPAASLSGQVVQLTIAFMIVCVVCHFPWIYAGKVILGRFRSEGAMRVQGWAFGTCMLAVAAYVALT
ncbi:LysE family translocator [Novosphingobium terrae]|uniref:LysE family translocator n=1 Tax=Novosphingobium terrae TaxID=2726189 RepID=UPI00198079A6|nr:LysE family translocator [Novosphingobium terrae]